MHQFIRTLIRRLYSPMTGMMLVSGGAGVLLVTWFGPHVHENGLSASLLGALRSEPLSTVVSDESVPVKERTTSDQKRVRTKSDDDNEDNRDDTRTEATGTTEQPMQPTATEQLITLLNSVTAPFARTIDTPEKFAEESVEESAQVSNRFGGSASLIARITEALPGYHYNHLIETKSGAYFFGYDPTEENPAFTWYQLDTDSEKAAPQPLLETHGDIGLLFNVAFSPDGTELLQILSNGEITITYVRSDTTEHLGTFVFTDESGALSARYSFPTYTPDGAHILLHDPWHNTLVIISADKKNIRKGKVVNDVWLEPFGASGFPESGTDMSVYSFSADGKTVTFGGVNTITL